MLKILLHIERDTAREPHLLPAPTGTL